MVRSAYTHDDERRQFCAKSNARRLWRLRRWDDLLDVDAPFAEGSKLLRRHIAIYDRFKRVVRIKGCKNVITRPDGNGTIAVTRSKRMA